MKSYLIKIKKKEEIAKDTIFLVLEKPKDFNFKAGQFIIMTLPQLPKDVEGKNFRAFSITSPPYQKEIEIVMRKGISSFKKKIEELKEGDNVEIKGPYGRLFLPDDFSRPVVFLVGGVGIAPIRSMLLEATKEKLPFRFSLFYSNNLPETTAFFEELKNLKNPNYKFIPTFTQLEKLGRDWSGERGFINLEMLKRYLSDIKNNLYYIVGPPPFVKVMKEMLSGAGVKKEQIKTEEFTRL